MTTIYDDAFVVPSSTSSKSAMIKINEFLNELVESSKSTTVVIFFDEAQLLLSDDAFPFRCIRWWLRKKMPHRKPVVIVFTGTTSKLANYYTEIITTGTSRDAVEFSYYDDEKVTKLYKPFYELRTTGIFAGESSNSSNENVTNDFVGAIKYGRPLFATLNWTVADEELSDRLLAICARMLLLTNSNQDWTFNSYFSILGTRVQFGQTYFNLASTLVSNGYAVLSSFDADSNAKVARICYQPDPVCAYIAMALMTPGFNFDKTNQHTIFMGKDPKHWSTKASELVTGGICVPAKGDVGEVAGALYLLYCGDYLRYEQNKELTTFSVSLFSWIDMLLQPRVAANSTPIGGETRNCHAVVDSESIFQVSFIQVCTNHLRHPDKFLTDEQLLREWYDAGVAYFACSQTFAYDVVAPIRFKTNKIHEVHRYCPLLVQIKNCDAFSSGNIETAFNSLREVFANATINIGVGIVLLVGHERPAAIKETMSKDIYKTDTLNNVSIWYENIQALNRGILMCCISVEDNDCYGINDLARSSIFGGQRAEFFESSSIINQLARSYKGPQSKKELSRFLRSKSNSSDIQQFNEIFDAFQESFSDNVNKE